MSDCQFTGASCYAVRLVLLTAGNNLTFTKKSKQANKFLDESHILTNSFGTKKNISTNSELDQFISVPTNDS